MKWKINEFLKIQILGYAYDNENADEIYMCVNLSYSMHSSMKLSYYTLLKPKKLSIFDSPGIKTDETAGGALEDDLKKAIDGQVINNYTVIHYLLIWIFDKCITEIIH